MKVFFKLFDQSLNVMAFLAGIILIFIMITVGLEVIMRYFFNRPLIWVTEVTECLLLYITFLGTAWLLREEGHVKVDVLYNRLEPRTQTVLGIIGSVIGIFISVILLIFGAGVTWDYFKRGIYTPTAMEIPVYLILWIIPVGSLFLLIQFLRSTGTFIAGFFMETGRSETDLTKEE